MSIVEQNASMSTVVEAGSRAVAVYMIRTRRYRSALFLPPESIQLCTAGTRDRIRSFIRKLMLHRNAIVRWLGRVFRAGHRFYQRLEDRIDPLERMLKALNGSGRLHVLHADHAKPRDEFCDLLRGQIVKHGAWFLVDAGLTVVAVAFSPFLVPIPGPNVILYYPALRLLSHYRALTGARSALNDSTVDFKGCPALDKLEYSLRSGETPRTGCANAGLRVTGLEKFLDGMV